MEDQARMSRRVPILGGENGEESIEDVLQELDELLSVEAEGAAQRLLDLVGVSLPLEQREDVDCQTKHD